MGILLETKFSRKQKTSQTSSLPERLYLDADQLSALLGIALQARPCPMVSVAASKPSAAPRVPEGWQAIWDCDENSWYYYHPRRKESQWSIPGAVESEKKVSGCGAFQVLGSLFKSKAPKVEKTALPSSRTLETIAQMDRDMNDEEIAMVLQHEEYSQDLSGRRHSFDNDWLDTSQYYCAQQEDEVQPTRPNTTSRPIRANMISGASHATIKEGDVHPGDGKPECGICMDDDDWRADWTWLECAHQFHTKCVEDWLKTAPRCPVCRTDCNIMV